MRVAIEMSTIEVTDEVMEIIQKLTELTRKLETTGELEIKIIPAPF